MNNLALKTEFKRYIRTRLYLILFIWFAFNGFTTVMMIKLLPKMQNSQPQKGIIIDESAFDWKMGLNSYLSNNIQIGLFIIIFVVVRAVSINKKSSLYDYYYVRAKSLFRLYIPRIIVSSLMIFLACLLGGIFVSISLQQLFGDINWSLLWESLLLQIVGITLMASIMAVIAGLMNSVGKSMGIFVLFYFVSLLLAMVSAIKKFLPLTFLDSTAIISGSKFSTEYGYSLFSLLFILVISLVFLYLKPIRFSTKQF